MNINLTLILQSIAMMIFVWFCMKFIWPPLTTALEQRRKKIAEGLAASDRAEQALEQANQQAEVLIREARDQATEIIDQAGVRGNQIVEEAKDDAVRERQRQVHAAEADIQQATSQAREKLRAEVVSLSVIGAEKVLGKEIDAGTHAQMIDELVAGT